MSRSRIHFLIQALNENAAYIDLIYNDTDLLQDTKDKTVYKVANVILNNSLELQHLIKNDKND
jgi:hypothetical protein